MGRDTSWHGEFLALVKGGLSFKEAVAKVGRGTATLNEHFRADRTFYANAKKVRGPRLNGPAPDVSWHARLPGLMAAGLSIPQAAERVGRSPITVRAHLRQFAYLRGEVDAALLAAGLPRVSLWSAAVPRPAVEVIAELETQTGARGLPGLVWYLEGPNVLAMPVTRSPARREAAVRQWAEVLGGVVKRWPDGVGFAITRDWVGVRIGTCPFWPRSR